MRITHLNPDTLLQHPAFSQGVTVKGAATLVFVGGQNGITRDGTMAGDDLAAQTRQAMKNVLAVLEAAGATRENVVKLTIYVVEGQDLAAGFAASQEVWSSHATAISVPLVAGLANPQALVEIEAVAAVEA